MIRKVLICSSAILLCTIVAYTQSDPPELSSWIRNTTGLIGYNSLPANVQQVRYSTNYVYVNSSGIPAYSIGPWPSDPNVPSNQNYLLRFSRRPAVNAGTKTSTSLGPIGLWVNGVPVFNSLDAMSYNNQNIWHQNAVVVEASSFDACLGHPAPGGAYHHHQNPKCLYSSSDTTQHSSLLGFAFDGYPIYGPYGFSNTDGSGGIRRIHSSYRTRNITQRTSLPDGTVLSPSQYGPNVSAQYPLGYYAEDFEYAGGLGDLDSYNGRFIITPEYPGGTYAYYVTINSDGSSAYPYAIGPQYYGVVAADDITSHGHVTIGETVSTYSPSSLQAPQLLAPLNNAHNQPVSLPLRWMSSSGATSYQLQVSEDSAFSSFTVNDSTVADTVQLVQILHYHTTYYWHVRAKNSSSTSAYSSTRSFMTKLTTPTLLGASGFSLSPLLHWSSSPGATAYHLQVASDSLFSSFTVNDSTITDSVSIIGPLDSASTYYSRVEATDANGSSDWSNILAFQTGNGVGLFSYSYRNQWNLISVPLSLSDYRKSIIFPGASSNAFWYEGTYAARETLRNGFGYWLKFSANVAIGMTGTPVLVDTVPVVPGWNLIGSIGIPIATHAITSLPPSMTTSSFFGYTTNYNTVDSLKPGYGYWVKVDSAGELILSSLTSQQSAISRRIQIVSGSELPPGPPGELIVDERSQTPESFRLEQNYPNPFNPTTMIRFDLEEESYVTLSIYNVLGIEVVNLLNGRMNSGNHVVEFDAKNLSSGVYLYKIDVRRENTPGRSLVFSKKMVVLR